jgi:colanic acid/amylovoran biosynthesis glycosyltransferase
VTVSDFNRDYLRDLLGDVPGEVRRLYNGIDLSLFRAAAAAPRDVRRIVAVGRLVEKKGFADLIAACGLLRDSGVEFRCEIIGQGPLESTLRSQIASLGVEEYVTLIGPRPQDEVLQAYQGAAIFALPCIVGADGNRDGLPTVLLEALATGAACVSTDVTGVPEILTHERDGLIVPQNDPAALAAALTRLLNDAELRARFARAGRARVERDFDVRQNVATLHAWLAEPTPLAVETTTAKRVILVEPS